MKRTFQSPDLASRAAWAGGFVVLVIVGFSLFTPSLGRRVGLWAIAVGVIVYLYGLQPRRQAGEDTLRSDELSDLALTLGSGGPMSPS